MVEIDMALFKYFDKVPSDQVTVAATASNLSEREASILYFSINILSEHSNVRYLEHRAISNSCPISSAFTVMHLNYSPCWR